MFDASRRLSARDEERRLEAVGAMGARDVRRLQDDAFQFSLDLWKMRNLCLPRLLSSKIIFYLSFI